jgi:hypothetical protein
LSIVTGPHAAPHPPPPEDPEERDLRLKRLEQVWKIRVAKADVVQKILISIVGALVAGIFYVFQANQTESRYYSELQAQRERADADLRANMFKTLFEAYFKNKIEATQKAKPGGADTPARVQELLVNLGQEIILSDLLARNFESMDVRPLFEDLDRRLTELIERGAKGQKVLPSQAEAFRQREQLRRAARGAATRQIELLRANAGAEVKKVRIEQCQQDPSSAPVFTPDVLPPLPGNAIGLVQGVADGSVRITLALPESGVPVPSNGVVQPAQPRGVPLTVTFFDMPALENLTLPGPGGRRMALTLTRSSSTRTCSRFSAQMDDSAREDCNPRADAPRASAGTCYSAEVWITLIPKDYIGPRDRPYLSDLYTSPFKALFPSGSK